MPWPPPPIPLTPPAWASDVAAATQQQCVNAPHARRWEYAEEEEEEEEVETQEDESDLAAEAQEAALSVAPGEVIWRAGDALSDETTDEEATEEVAFALSEEWAARFALTEHRRAQRASLLSAPSTPLTCARLSLFSF